jgi:penicillin-binding protein 1A
MTKARVRQQYVLNRMVDDGYITAATASAAYATPPTIVRHTATATTTSIAPQFVRSVEAQVVARYKTDPDQVYESGMAIHTTLDSSWQQAATTALGNVLKQTSDPEAAVVVMDSDNGQVLGIADKVDAATAQVDTARQAYRTSGSTIKPFTLATALETGTYTLDSGVYGPATKTYPASQCATTNGQPYTIHNDEGGGGYYTLESALAKSVNTVYGPLAITVGTKKVYATAQAAGLVDPTLSQGQPQTQCSMGLGVNVTPLDEAVGYSTLADGGVHHGASYISSISEGVGATGSGGSTIYTASDPGTQAIPAAVDAKVQTAMRAVVRYGTGTAAQQPDGLDVFGKTGTTDDFTDAWFSGCVPAYHVCVTTWMGYNDNRSLTDVEGVYHVAGGTLPAKVFAQTMDDYRSLAHPVVAVTSSAPVQAPTLAPVSPSAPPSTPGLSSESTPAITPSRSRTAPASTSSSSSTSPTASTTPSGAGTPTP